MKKLIQLSLLVTILALAGAACEPQVASAGAPQAWIDAPLDGMQLPLAPYEIVAHADDPAGIAQFEFSVNGSVIATTAGGAGSLSTVRQMWNPAAQGDYVIAVRALSAAGSWGGTAVVHVQIFDAQFKTPVPPTGTARAQPTPTATHINVPTFVLIMNANCRFGPGQVFNELDAAYAGDNVPIEGKNEDGTWWLVHLPNGVLCWVSGATGNPIGDLTMVRTVQSPATPIPPPTPEVEQGCFVFDPNLQPVCTIPCPPNANPGGECTP